MPKNKVSDPITDQEMAFARLVLSGAMTDRNAAESVGLNPDSAAYTKSKPHVRAYMLEHRAAVQQQTVQQEADGLHRLNLDREQVLTRLWELANLSPEMTRNSITGQVKALSIIVAIEGLIPDRRAVPAQNNSAPPPVRSKIYASAWLTKQHGQPQPPPAPAPEAAIPDLSSRLPRQPRRAVGLAVEPERPAPAGPGSAVEEPAVPLPPMPDPVPDLSQSNFPSPLNPSPTASSPRPHMSFVPDTRLPFSIDRSPFKHFLRRR